jgi:methionyl-tRNA synthetase
MMEQQYAIISTKYLIRDVEKCPKCGTYNVVGEKCDNCVKKLEYKVGIKLPLIPSY